MISCKNLKKKYGKKEVISDISLEIHQGEIVGLLGPNGAGKTTTFYMITGLIKPTKGKIYLNNIDITPYSMYQRAQLGIGYLPQESSIFKKLTVEENFFILWEELKTYKKKDYAEQLDIILNEFGIKHIQKSKGIELSGGEKRRVEIARTLALNPKFILLDEPFAGIDPITIQEIQDIILKLQKKNIGIIISDHNVKETLKITTKASIMYDGKILLQGNSDQIIKNKEVQRIYLGDQFQI